MKNYIYILPLIIALIGCNSSEKKEENLNPQPNTSNIIVSKDQFNSSKMVLGNISNQEFLEVINTNGFIDVPPENKADVSALMGGYIKSSPFLIGDNVEKGELLLTIENPDFIEVQQNYLEIFERLNYLKSEYERQKTLYEEKITSEKNYLDAESNYKSNLANFNGLEQKLRLMNINIDRLKKGDIVSVLPIYAPISGYISNVYVTIGKYMEPTDVLIEIINNTHKHLELVVFEKEALDIKPEQKILFQIPENSKETFEAEVHLIGKSIDQENRTVKVHGHILDEKKSFLVGMFVEAEIIINTTKKSALPINAIIEEDDAYYVLALKKANDDSYEFEKLPVFIGEKGENWIEITNVTEELQNKQLLIEGVFVPTEEN